MSTENIPPPDLMPLNPRRHGLPAAGPVWIGLRVRPEITVCPVSIKCIEDETIWARDLAHAERVCKARDVLSIVLERAGVRVLIDYGSETFADFIDACRWELAFNPPDFDSQGEETLTRDAIKALYSMLPTK